MRREIEEKIEQQEQQQQAAAAAAAGILKRVRAFVVCVRVGGHQTQKTKR